MTHIKIYYFVKELNNVNKKTLVLDCPNIVIIMVVVAVE